MKTFTVKIEGVAPLLMENETLLNPFEPLSIRLHEITRKGSRKRTEQDEKELFWISFQANLYWSESIPGPVVPTKNVKACIRDGAKHFREGKKVKAGLTINTEADFLPLIYAGRFQQPALLYKDPRFIDIRGVRRKSVRIIACRPRFNEWGLEIPIGYDPEVIKSKEDVLKFLAAAGRYEGLCSYKPEFGRFKIISDS